MTTEELKSLYLDFFGQKGHAVIPGASLIPENDPTVLFTTAGMHPLVPFLMGETHPAGKRLVNCQKCIRTGDIGEVGDATHLTFFEMLGNWSLGDYFKREAIGWSFEFLTDRRWLGFDSGQLHVTVFAGDDLAPPDEESAALWEELGIPGERIYYLDRSENWWGPAGATGPCGPDTEMFVDTGAPACGEGCRPGCGCGKYFEVWNDVFLSFNRLPDGTYAPLDRVCVDTGMGVERTVAMMNGYRSIYQVPVLDTLAGFVRKLCGAGDRPGPDALRSIRVVADHIRTSVQILGDDLGVPPSNLDQGYVLRRLIRVAIRHARKLGIDDPFTEAMARLAIETEKSSYPELQRNRERILTEIAREEEQFGKTLRAGLREYEKLLPGLLRNPARIIPGRIAFRLHDTYGFPVEFTVGLAAEHGLRVDMDGYQAAFDKHRELSRKGAERKFSGGLADHSAIVTRLHTATHLLHQALRMVLGEHVEQRGSNITHERLRFDFSHPEKLTEEQVREVEAIVNRVIDADLPVACEEMTAEEAGRRGAIGLFGDRYGDRVKVYTVGEFSCEICGGPHVTRTGELGRFRIVSEKSSSSGIRRIRAVLEAT
ncbi:alanine--tRNA ligase [Candidatus Fermentibacterales bacterium]|nr:alanine--tRNA ligase [Candidatus Fermentibacterales bacterium]